MSLRGLDCLDARTADRLPGAGAFLGCGVVRKLGDGSRVPRASARPILTGRLPFRGVREDQQSSQAGADNARDPRAAGQLSTGAREARQVGPAHPKTDTAQNYSALLQCPLHRNSSRRRLPALMRIEREEIPGAVPPGAGRT